MAKFIRLPAFSTGENGAYINPADINCIRVYKQTSGFQYGMPVSVNYVVVITTKYDSTFKYSHDTLEEANKFQEKIAQLINETLEKDIIIIVPKESNNE